jgi:two-component system sensor histidine kinase KdpD
VQLELVLTNLIENSAKYAPPQTQIDIGAQVNGDMLEISIADHGPGIPMGEEERIFEKFFRSASEHHKPGGSGLGLTIAKGITEAHGGRIRAENRPGGGALFTVCLPAITFYAQAAVHTGAIQRVRTPEE